jgi:hypothetical protein
LKANADCVRPDGARQATTSRVLGTRGELRLPLEVVVPGEYRFRWSVTDGKGWILASGERALTLEPFAGDRALFERALAALRDTADAVEEARPSSAQALRREATLLAVDVEAARAAQDAAPGGGADAERKALEVAADAVKDSRRAVEVAKAVGRAVPCDSLVAFEGELWESRGVDERIPAEATNPVVVSTVLFPANTSRSP